MYDETLRYYFLWKRVASIMLSAVVLMAAITVSAQAKQLLQPALSFYHKGTSPAVAITLDACTGKVDERIMTFLLKEKIPVTLFVTARWLRRNAAAVAIMNRHPELFEIENHGGLHKPAIDYPTSYYGLEAAGSLPAIREEIGQGEMAVMSATGNKPEWYRGAAAVYTLNSINLIRNLHYRIAGYTIAADQGAAAGEALTRKNIANAASGAVILVHINHPERSAGAGVVEGLADLKAKGFRFVRLDDAVFSKPH